MNEFARILWKIVGEKCRVLEKFIIPKELTYSSTLNSVIGEKYSVSYPATETVCLFVSHHNIGLFSVNGSCLHQLTLKRNIPNNMFLHDIGLHCPNLQGRPH